jgi:hypothetical protein
MPPPTAFQVTIAMRVSTSAAIRRLGGADGTRKGLAATIPPVSDRRKQPLGQGSRRLADHGLKIRIDSPMWTVTSRERTRHADRRVTLS